MMTLAIEVSVDDDEALRVLGSRLRTQANACTETPAFTVQEWRGIEGWVGVQWFLTAAAAEFYLASNLHNLKQPKDLKKQPRVYTEGGFRNHERQLLRRVLMALPPPITPRSWRDVLEFKDDEAVTVERVERRVSHNLMDAHLSGRAEIVAAHAAALAEIGGAA